jgi:ferredoxin
MAVARAAVDEAADHMGRYLETENLPQILTDAADDRHWDEIAGRCLTCGNCTMVCPTCFCANIEDTTDLSGNEATRTRRWDSCFSVQFSYIHGGSVRAGEMSRYRQWMTHKLGYWQEQFDVLGCVGCGRCITWCPVGIDITEEARKFREKV